VKHITFLLYLRYCFSFQSGSGFFIKRLYRRVQLLKVKVKMWDYNNKTIKENYRDGDGTASKNT